MKQRRAKIAGTIADKTLKNGVSRQFSKQVAAYLLSERRVNELDSILRDVQADWAGAGYVEITATSAHPLTAAIKTDITRRVKQLHPTAKWIVITEVHDPAVIGGVRISVADQQLDLSLKARLNKFKQLTMTGKD